MNKAWLQTIFDRHDLNRDGRLTLGEFMRLAKWLDGTLTTEQCEEAFAQIDQTLSGYIEFVPFFSWWTARFPTRNGGFR